MARYGAGFSVAGVNTANTQVVSLANTAVSQRLRIMQIVIGVNVSPTTAPSFYLTRATARGTQSAVLAGNPYDLNEPASIGSLDTAWSVAPTFSITAKLGVAGLSVTAGGFWVWDLRDSPIIVPNLVTAGLVVANANASGVTLGTFTGSIVWEE